MQGIQSVESDSFADRERVGYRLAVRCPDGNFLVEQQAYIEERDGTIGWMRVGAPLAPYLRPFSLSTTPNTSPSR